MSDPLNRDPTVRHGVAETVAPGVRRVVAPNPSPMTRDIQTDQIFTSNEKPTLRTVAKATGFSVATVSRALADDPRIAERTRATVAEAAERLGYIPDRAARRAQGPRTLARVRTLRDPRARADRSAYAWSPARLSRAGPGRSRRGRCAAAPFDTAGRSPTLTGGNRDQTEGETPWHRTTRAPARD